MAHQSPDTVITLPEYAICFTAVGVILQKLNKHTHTLSFTECWSFLVNG